MTREEAILILEEEAEFLYGDFLYGDAPYNKTAFDMAIEALNEADKREQYGQNYEADDFVKLGVTDKNKDKVILYDAFGEKEYYPIEVLQKLREMPRYLNGVKAKQIKQIEEKEDD